MQSTFNSQKQQNKLVLLSIQQKKKKKGTLRRGKYSINKRPDLKSRCSCQHSYVVSGRSWV